MEACRKEKKKKLTNSSWQYFNRAKPTLNTILTPWAKRKNVIQHEMKVHQRFRHQQLRSLTSWRKTSQILRAKWNGKEYEKTVMNHWLAYMLGFIISWVKCSPTLGKSSLTKLSNWKRYCCTSGSPTYSRITRIQFSELWDAFRNT